MVTDKYFVHSYSQQKIQMIYRKTPTNVFFLLKKKLDAVSNMHNDVAEYLRVHGGEVEERRMMHLMCKALRRCDRRLLRQLLQWFNGATVVDYDGQSGYHICVNMGDAEMLRILAKAGMSKLNKRLFSYCIVFVCLSETCMHQFRSTLHSKG